MSEGSFDTLPRKVAIVLAADLATGASANVAACLSAGLSAAQPRWAGRPLTDRTGFGSVASSHLPIAVLRAQAQPMQALFERLANGPREPESVVSLFPAYAQAMHDCTDYWQRHMLAVHTTEPMLGIGLYGPKKWVSSLVGSLPLWR